MVPACVSWMISAYIRTCMFFSNEWYGIKKEPREFVVRRLRWHAALLVSGGHELCRAHPIYLHTLRKFPLQLCSLSNVKCYNSSSSNPCNQSPHPFHSLVDAPPVAVAVVCGREIFGGGARVCRSIRARCRGARVAAAARRACRNYAIGLEAHRILITTSLARYHRFLGPLLMLIDTVLFLELF